MGLEKNIKQGEETERRKVTRQSPQPLGWGRTITKVHYGGMYLTVPQVPASHRYTFLRVGSGSGLGSGYKYVFSLFLPPLSISFSPSLFLSLVDDDNDDNDDHHGQGHEACSFVSHDVDGQGREKALSLFLMMRYYQEK